MHFRRSPKDDLNSDLLTIVAQKCPDGRCSEARGDSRSGAARPSVGIGGTIPKILIGIQWDVWQRWDITSY